MNHTASSPTAHDSTPPPSQTAPRAKKKRRKAFVESLDAVLAELGGDRETIEGAARMFDDAGTKPPRTSNPVGDLEAVVSIFGVALAATAKLEGDTGEGLYDALWRLRHWLRGIHATLYETRRPVAAIDAPIPFVPTTLPVRARRESLTSNIAGIRDDVRMMFSELGSLACVATSLNNDHPLHVTALLQGLRNVEMHCEEIAEELRTETP